MLDALVANLIGSLADLIASTATTMASDQQERRDKLADYEAKASHHIAQLETGIVALLQPAVRNRYQDWLAHPRLGHEPPAAELRAAEIGLNEAVLQLRANPSGLNQALSIGASIRLTAIAEALGVACIYHDASKRPTPLAAKRAAKPIRADDKRLNRRPPVIGDVPDALRPVVSRLAASHPQRAAAIEELEAQRGGALDGNGIATRLATLVAHADYEAFIATLSAQAAVINGPAAGAPVATDMVSPPPSLSTPKPLTAVGPVAPVEASAAAAIVTAPRTDADIAADVAAVTKFVAERQWALIEKAGRYSLKKLDRRGDISAAFDRVADLPTMQEALGRIHASQRSSTL